MSTLYRPLTQEEKLVHLNPQTIPTLSGIYASGEANFADFNQFVNAPLIPPPSETDFGNSVVAPVGLNFSRNAALSNGPLSRFYSINDFLVFNPYIHYVPNPNGGAGILDPSSSAFKINFSSQFTASSSVFNLYNKRFRISDPTIR